MSASGLSGELQRSLCTKEGLEAGRYEEEEEEETDEEEDAGARSGEEREGECEEEVGEENLVVTKSGGEPFPPGASERTAVIGNVAQLGQVIPEVCASDEEVEEKGYSLEEVSKSVDKDEDSEDEDNSEGSGDSKGKLCVGGRSEADVRRLVRRGLEKRQKGRMYRPSAKESKRVAAGGKRTKKGNKLNVKEMVDSEF